MLRIRVAPVLTAALLILGVATAPTGVAFGSKSPRHTKALSLSNVVFSGGTSASAIPFWVALSRNLFKQQGLNLTYLTSATSTAQIALLVSGGAQFVTNSPSTDVPAVVQGAPFRALVQVAQNSVNEIVMTQTAATQFDIPPAGNSASAALAQFRALKGSHITMAVSSLNSGSYGDLALVAERTGLTFGSGCTSCDINIESVGSTTNQTADLEAGKVQSIIGVPPTTVVTSPATVTIEVWRIPPLPSGASSYLITTSTLIDQHADTVQAFVTAYLAAQEWVADHPVGAEKIASASFATYGGITSPEEQEYLYSGELPFLKFPYPSKTSFSVALEEANATLGTNDALPYTSFVVSRIH